MKNLFAVLAVVLFTGCTQAQMNLLIARHNERSFQNLQQQRDFTRAIRNFNRACQHADCGRLR